MNGDMILILDFGGSQSQSVARKVRGERVYCEVLPYHVGVGAIRAKAPKGLMLVGGSGEVSEPNAPNCAAEVYDMGLPILGIGYGARILLKQMGGRSLGTVLEKHMLQVAFKASPLFEGLTECERYIERLDALDLPDGVTDIAGSGGMTAAFADEEKRMYGMQFNAEQNDLDGLRILANFSREICGCDPWWSMETFVEGQLQQIREQVGGGSALMAISGGVDSSVCAVMMHRAIGRQMRCLYVDTGLMRKNETALVREAYAGLGMDLICVDAVERFLGRLKGVVDPERKRKIIGEEFVRVFEDEARKLGEVDCLVQGTIYPDVIESYGVDGALVKSHHNVGGLPTHIEFKTIVEPVRELFKDEVRQVGEALCMPKELIYRQPFPGPGLAVRCLGEVNREKLDILREADAIFREEVESSGLSKRVWQYFAVLTDVRSTGIKGGKRSYDYAVALRAINSIDAMTATAFRMPYDLLERVVERITSEVEGVNRIVYDVTGKPPATIEWE